jgi:hypothetical protein
MPPMTFVTVIPCDIFSAHGEAVTPRQASKTHLTVQVGKVRQAQRERLGKDGLSHCHY